MNLLYVYGNYEYESAAEELEKIKNAKLAYIYVDEKSKKCLFLLGMLFAYGVPIIVTNKEQLVIPEEGKSFAKMTYAWEKLSDSNFPGEEYQNVKTKFDGIIENFKRMGVRHEHKIITGNNTINQSFLICPVRNATLEQRNCIEDFVYESENYYNKHVYAPHLETRQQDLLGGYAICKQNATALASSQDFWIFYDKTSTGSVFDLGVAYALEKPRFFLNDPKDIIDENDFIDNLLMNWPYQESHVKTRR